MKKLALAALAVILAACSAAPADLPDSTQPAAPIETETTEPVPSEAASPPQTGDMQEVRSEQPRNTDPQASPEQVGSLVEGNNAFAIDLYRQATMNEDNLIFSPYSISLAFSMLYGGAQGVTEEEIADVFHFLPQDEHHEAFNAVDMQLTAPPEPLPTEEAGDPFQLEIANAVWGQDGFNFLDDYLNLLAENYGAGMRLIDFMQDPSGAAREINEWVEEQTQGRIQDILPEDGVITPDTRMVLANAIYFKASWLYPFNESATSDGNFTQLDGTQVTLPMMHSSSHLPYFQGDGYQAVSLPYTGNRQEMLIILPDEGSFEEIENQLSAEMIREASENASSVEVSLSMPKWDFETDLDLSGLLGEMGLVNPFTTDADFSGISGDRSLFVSDAIHKANITVDEEGTEAAAATLIVVGVTAAMETVEVNLDRPFIFAIRDIDTGAILFLGRVAAP